MNNGAFGENFPYSNFHDLNMDWIIKIAKDFLDQYTNIQDTITEGIEQLQNTATELEGLLNQWYETHSEDIANELLTSINAFRTTANQIGVDVIASIPEDYTALSNDVKSRTPFTFESVGSYTLRNEDFIVGSSSTNMYEPLNLSYRIRTQSPIHVRIGDKYNVKYNSFITGGFIGRYDEEGNYLGDRVLIEGEYPVNWNGYIVPVFYKDQSTNIQPSDYDAEITIIPRFIDEMYFAYPFAPEYTYNRCFSTVTKAWYSEAGLECRSAIFPINDFHNIHIVKGYANRNTPVVAFFSSDTPSASSYIVGYGAGSLPTPELIENIDITIPNGATHMVIQSFTLENNMPVVTKTTSISEYVLLNDNNIDNVHNIEYEVNNDSVLMTFPYKEGVSQIYFGRRGVNQLPDFRDIILNGVNYYAGHTDWIAPYQVAAKNNINGDDPDTHTFTGGNHNYNNVGGSSASPTAENVYIKFYADNELIKNGFSGHADTIRIEWKNRVQAYNTRKADGSGRYVLEETHILTFDGTTMEILADIEPLENVKVETWYAYQAYAHNWPNIFYIGTENRRRNDIANASNSLGNKPNGAICKDSNNNKLIMELDRTFDLGQNTMYDGTEGMFTSGNKLYFNVIKNSDLGYNKHYYLKGIYKFIP